MNALIQQLNTLLGDKDVAQQVFALVNKPTAQQKYIRTQARKEAHKRSNDVYLASKPVDVDAVKDHLVVWRAANVTDTVKHEIHTHLWENYRDHYVKIGKVDLTRKVYKEQLDLLGIATTCPHVRSGKTYYVSGYVFEPVVTD